MSKLSENYFQAFKLHFKFDGNILTRLQMMVSFYYFLLIVTTLFPFALGDDNVKCTNEIKRGDICCGGDVYRIAQLIWPDASCNIEPKNATLTFADSAWLAYYCNVRKRLNSTGLTPKSYLNLLLRVQNSSQSQLWESWKFQDDNYENRTLGEDEYDKIQTIKTYQWKWLEALEKICTFRDGNSTSGNARFNSTSTNFKTRFSKMQYSRECNNEMLPFSGYYAGSDYTYASHVHIDKCQQEFNQTLGKATFHKFLISIFTLCGAIGSKNLDIKPQIVSPTLDFEGIVTSLSPAFWSKSVKISVKNSTFEALKQEFKTQDLENLESLMRNKVEKMFSQNLSEGEILASKHEFVHAMMILQISEVFLNSAGNVCRLNASRKGNAGM